MTVKQVAIRLQPEDAGVVRMFKDTESAGVHAQTAVASATERSVAANDRLIAKIKEANAAMAAASASTGGSSRQYAMDTAAGVNRADPRRAQASASLLFAADDGFERRAAQIRAQVDPLWAAQERLNSELAEYNKLAKVGALGSRELAAAQALARTRFDEATAALNRQNGGLSKQAAQGRLNLARQGADVFTTAAMGMSPAMIAIQQGPQILDALTTSGFKASGSLLLVGGALTAAAAGVAVLAASWMHGEDAALKLEKAVTGLGRTSGVTASQLEMLAQTGAKQAEISVSAARDQAAAYISTGKIGGEVTAKLIALSKDYVAFTGLEMADAQKQLAKDMAEPDVAARELTRQFGLLDQTTLAHIDTLVKLGKRQEAQIIVADALAGAISGQADRVGEVTSAWDAASRAVSNYWDQLGRALYTTPDERLMELNSKVAKEREVVARTGRRTGRLDILESQQRVAMTQQGIRQMLDDGLADRSQDNQAAQEAKDRRDKVKTPRADHSAEREARERLARERAEEDRRSELQRQIAELNNDPGQVRRLEDEVALRSRIRQLVDAKVPAAEAETKALAEQGQLLAARAVADDRSLITSEKAFSIEYERTVGNERWAQSAERQVAFSEAILGFQKHGLDLVAATSVATRNQLDMDQARATVLARIVASAETENRLTLARLSGNTSVERALDRAARIEARARQIEGRESLNYGEGNARAASEIGQEVRAEMVGNGRDWAKGLAQDIRGSGIKDALSEQFDQAGERFADKLVDILFDMDWSKLFNGGGSGGGAASLLSKGVSMLFGRNADGTDYWGGGPTWVGERGPELIWAPRGAAITESGKSRKLAATSGASAPAINHYYLQGSVTSDELWRRIDRGDAVAAQRGATGGAGMAVTTVRSSASQVQRQDHMLKN